MAFLPLHAFGLDAKKTLARAFDPDKEDGELNLFHLICAAFIAMSIGVSVLCVNRVLHAGQPTEFPPDEPRQEFTDGPDTRGTINIIWACLLTIFTCVYVSLHLDVAYSEREPRGRKEKFWAVMKSIRRKSMWIAINILAPELIALVAVFEFSSAKKQRKEILNEFKTINHKRWTLKHAFFANMGGFKVPVLKEEPTEEEGTDYDGLKEQSGSVLEEGLALVNEKLKTEEGLSHDYVILRSGKDFIT